MKVMAATQTMFMVRVDRGEEVVAALREFARGEKVECAAVSGLGALRDTRLAFFDAATREYHERLFEPVLELVNFTGNLGLLEGEPFLHAHVILSDEEYRCYGGHLVSAVIGVTGEFAVSVGVAPIVRRFNPELGIKEQDLPG